MLMLNQENIHQCDSTSFSLLPIFCLILEMFGPLNNYFLINSKCSTVVLNLKKSVCLLHFGCILFPTGYKCFNKVFNWEALKHFNVWSFHKLILSKKNFANKKTLKEALNKLNKKCSNVYNVQFWNFKILKYFNL